MYGGYYNVIEEKKQPSQKTIPTSGYHALKALPTRRIIWRKALLKREMTGKSGGGWWTG
jgi:hypothetical protein